MAAPGSFAPPTLESGDRLTPEEFDRIYAQCGETGKAELIDGVVYVASPVRIGVHARPHGRLGAVLHYYADSWPGSVRRSLDRHRQRTAHRLRFGRHGAITSETVAFFDTPLPDMGARAEAWGIYNWLPRR